MELGYQKSLLPATEEQLKGVERWLSEKVAMVHMSYTLSTQAPLGEIQRCGLCSCCSGGLHCFQIGIDWSLVIEPWRMDVANQVVLLDVVC